MFCPKCATQNVDGASYCRSCGANISMVPQALTGQLSTTNPPDAEHCYDRGWRRGAPSMDRAVRSLIMGVAFAVMIAVTSTASPSKPHWWFWLIIPAMLMFGRGFVELLRVHGAKNRPQPASGARLNSVRPLEIPSVKTGELINAVPSVTEGTTRHLETEARTQRL